MDETTQMLVKLDLPFGYRRKIERCVQNIRRLKDIKSAICADICELEEEFLHLFTDDVRKRQISRSIAHKYEGITSANQEIEIEKEKIQMIEEYHRPRREAIERVVNYFLRKI